MENLDIYLLTAVITTLFAVFIGLTYRELKEVDRNPNRVLRDGGPRVALFRLMARLFEDDTLPKQEKKRIYKAMYRTMADMESDGIRFPDEIKEELQRTREELNCEYSGLPSPKAYEDPRTNHL
jgi:hypothetical protein